jgi:hypothetical protein
MISFNNNNNNKTFHGYLLLFISILLPQIALSVVTPFTCDSTLLSGGAPNYFTFTGSNCVATIPASATGLNIYMWGAGGGYGTDDGGGGGGGSGAYVEGFMTVVGGSTITVIVGEGASTCKTSTYFGGGGSAGSCVSGTGKFIYTLL